MSKSATFETSVSRGIGVHWAQGLVLVALFTTTVFFVIRLVGVNDTDLWWHMAVGRWIVEHGAIPYTEPFSNSGAGRPFEAYSWLFELIVFWCFKRFGLVGIVVFSATITVALAATIQHMVRRLNSTFLLGIGITFFSVYIMGRLYTPRPWLLSMLLFAIELDILSRARKTGRSRELLWLPLIFALWVNIHIQFVDGLVLLGIALLEAFLSTRWSEIRTNFHFGRMIAVCAGCFLGTLINPYGLNIYKVAYDLVAQGAALTQLPELSAIPFRSFDDWCVLLIALAASIALVRAQQHSFFEILLLAFAIVVSFRSQRDIWVVAIAGAAILASNLPERRSDAFMLRWPAIPLVGTATIVFAVLAFRVMGVNEAKLQTGLDQSLPVKAADAIKTHNWSGPIYNDYGWGGYLIWSLQQPVSMYGRNTVYGVEKVLRSNASWNGYAGWESDPDLLQANLIIAKRDAPLVQLLMLQPCLQAAYEDPIAIVFIPNSSLPQGDKLRNAEFCAARQPGNDKQ